MDVVVKPVSGSEKVWSLTDRLGRPIGHITGSGENQFVIAAVDPGEINPLSKIDAFQPTLDAAMDAIALRLKGVCQLSSTEGRWWTPLYSPKDVASGT